MMSRSNFARSQSKVWFGNEPNSGPYGGFRPYGYNLHSGPMSRPTYPTFHDLEEEDELIEEQQMDSKNAATNSWAETNRQGSPASHKSQDSGFSDTETSLNAGGSLVKRGNINDSQSSSGTTEKLTPKRSVNEELFERSPSLNSSAPTPPTVIRRPAPMSPRTGQELGRRLSYSESTETQTGSESPRNVSLKRGRVITKNSRVKRNLSDQLSNSSEEMISLDSSELTNILNRSVREGAVTESLSEPDANNNNAIKGESVELPTYSELYPTRGTSTPIRGQAKLYRSLPLSPTKRVPPPPTVRPVVAPSGTDNFYEESNNTVDSVSDHALSYTIYDNPLLNGHQPAVQGWLEGLRYSCQSEVMSILQTKSIATEAGRSLRLTSTVAVKILRHLQAKVSTLQGSFERVEKLFSAIRKYQTQRENTSNEQDEDDEKEIYQKVAAFVYGLATDIDVFVRKQQGTDYFGREASERDDRRKFAENARTLADMTADLRAAASSNDSFDYRSAEEEVQIVKRYFLITVRIIFKNLVRVIVDAVEGARCELILRSNLSYVASLSNLDFGGLASLNDAFIANGTVRVLLLVCVESKLSSVRALALRALATVCSTTETIRQLERADGLEVLRDILTAGADTERTEPELREAVSVLTQITAPWHGEEHRLEGMKQFVHAIVEAITDIIERTKCCQTLLLCTASLNNMTRIEPTAVYALMSQDTVGKLQTAIEQRGPGASIFLYEQLTAMLYNMSANWKCHHHLAGRPLIAFLVTKLNQKFHERMANGVESEAQRKTIRNILHVLSRLLTGGSLSSGASHELIETTIGPVLARIERTLDGGSEHYQDISFVSRRCNESLATRSTVNSEGTEQSTHHQQQQPHITRLTVRRDPVNGPVMVLDQNRQESYV
uniref:Protein inscuteable homologue C-terminal domain-containing protein n=1 Tax=Anopheles farauti TaxID=69004 RepID=A0A182QJC7_9DIPT